MIKLLAILIIALMFEAVGVVFLSKGLKQLPKLEQASVTGVLRLVGSGVTNRNILAGIFFEAIFFSGLLILMSRADVSFVWPLTALGFGFTTLAARFVLHEHISMTRWAGVFLIIMGAGLITWSEKLKTAPPSSQVAPPESSRLT